MMTLLSPTKQMDFISPLSPSAETWLDSIRSVPRRPRYMSEAAELAGRLATLEETDLESLMGISPALAQKTAAEFRQFDGNAVERPALFAFSGTVFGALDANTLSMEDLRWADHHVRILSGLFGILKAGDAVRPYRLEMKTPFKPADGKTLTAFWRNRIHQEIPKDGWILNLASQEYAKVLDKKSLGDRIINFSFKERNDSGKLRTVGMYAKTARGAMLRRIIKEKPEDPSQLQSDETGGYRFSEEHSDSGHWVFLREG